MISILLKLRPVASIETFPGVEAVHMIVSSSAASACVSEVATNSLSHLLSLEDDAEQVDEVNSSPVHEASSIRLSTYLCCRFDASSLRDTCSSALCSHIRQPRDERHRPQLYWLVVEC